MSKRLPACRIINSTWELIWTRKLPLIRILRFTRMRRNYFHKRWELIRKFVAWCRRIWIAKDRHHHSTSNSDWRCISGQKAQYWHRRSLQLLQSSRFPYNARYKRVCSTYSLSGRTSSRVRMILRRHWRGWCSWMTHCSAISRWLVDSQVQQLPPPPPIEDISTSNIMTRSSRGFTLR